MNLAIRLTDIIKKEIIVSVVEKTYSLYIRNRNGILLDKKSPCGRAPSRTELRKCLFYVLNTQKTEIPCIYKIEHVILLGKKLRERT